MTVGAHASLDEQLAERRYERARLRLDALTALCFAGRRPPLRRIVAARCAVLQHSRELVRAYRRHTTWLVALHRTRTHKHRGERT